MEFHILDAPAVMVVGRGVISVYLRYLSGSRHGEHSRKASWDEVPLLPKIQETW